YQQRLDKKYTDYKRQQKLYDSGVIAKMELENSEFDYDLAKNNLQQFVKQQQSNWQLTITELENKYQDLKSSSKQLQQNSKNYILKATASGTLLNVKGLQVGGFLQAGFQFGEISPSGKLLVECYVLPLDIGLLKLGDTCNFQIDAFNYNRWGLATGQIIEISEDVEMMENKPVFKVRCEIDQQYLQLKNGFKGNLIKGMTLNARFTLANRSLYQLLYDKMDDWLNPNNKKQ
ncbi:MAG: HlyD family efflux transporter periplasmic adaptor subunit, partial [Flavobacteriaceae bacterium]|nr:HlyD family efflux transporter periplasmic adaptor subunit [Flavobacteriaceae bacterium]